MAYVYRHIRLDKNEPFYVGISNDDNYERAYIKGKTRRSKLWHNIIKKTKYEVEVMIDGISIEDAIKKEVEFIALYGRINIGTGILANLTDGGEGTNRYIHTEETKRKMSISRIGNKNSIVSIDNVEIREQRKKRALGNSFAKGVKRTEEQKEKNRISHIGKKHSEETKRKIKASWDKRKENVEVTMNRHLSDEHKLKLSIAFKGRKIPEEIKQKMRGKRGKYKPRKNN